MNFFLKGSKTKIFFSFGGWGAEEGGGGVGGLELVNFLQRI